MWSDRNRIVKPGCRKKDGKEQTSLGMQNRPSARSVRPKWGEARTSMERWTRTTTHFNGIVYCIVYLVRFGNM